VLQENLREQHAFPALMPNYFKYQTTPTILPMTMTPITKRRIKSVRPVVGLLSAGCCGSWLTARLAK
jgi:hypothetical protein